MITFVTLFLGLVMGPRTVEVHVDERVDHVELRLDGEPLEQINGPPWTSLVDFGSALMPHELVAIAFDAEDRELDRSRQWINLARDPAEAELIVTELDSAAGPLARLTWKNVIDARPKKARLLLDGQALPEDESLFAAPATQDTDRKPRNSGEVRLPRIDPDQLHLLRAELEFPGNLTSTAEITFGGTYADEVTTELTAVPLSLTPNAPEPTLQTLAQAVLGPAGKALQPTAVETGIRELLIVASPGSGQQLAKIVRSSPKRDRRTRTPRSWAEIDPEARLRVFWPYGVSVPESYPPTILILRSESLNPDRGGIVWQLQHATVPKTLGGTFLLADAVAVAGMAATERDRRRALLVLISEREDRSRLRPRAVLDYLASLGVPVALWSLHDQPIDPEWGPVTRIDSFAALEQATARLNAKLASQRIVWVEGDHLPQSLQLHPESTAGWTIAGRKP